MATVEDDGDTCGVPALCIIAAYQQASGQQRRMLMELTGSDDGPTVILPVLATDVGHMADLVTKLPHDVAHAASAAV